MAKATYIQRGDTITAVNISGVDLATGEIMSVGGERVGVVAADTASGAVGGICMVGVFEMPKAAALEINFGDTVYFDADTGTVTKTNTDTPCGYAVAEAAADAATVQVKIG